MVEPNPETKDAVDRWNVSSFDQYLQSDSITDYPFNSFPKQKTLWIDETFRLSINIFNQVQSQTILSTPSLKWSHCSQVPTDEANSYLHLMLMMCSVEIWSALVMNRCMEATRQAVIRLLIWHDFLNSEQEIGITSYARLNRRCRSVSLSFRLLTITVG